MAKNSFGAAAKLRVGNVEYDYFSLSHLAQQGIGNVGRLPFSIRILLENLLRNEDGKRVSQPDVVAVASGDGAGVKEISFMPARVCCGTLPVVDLAAMRDALAAMGSDPSRANPCCRPI
jgi:aconitate hydratase